MLATVGQTAIESAAGGVVLVDLVGMVVPGGAVVVRATVDVCVGVVGLLLPQAGSAIASSKVVKLAMR